MQSETTLHSDHRLNSAAGIEAKRKSRETLYGEHKKPTMISLTPTGAEKLEALAAEFSLSRSELIEQIARGIIPISTVRSA